MKVLPVPGLAPLEGMLRYIENEHSFRFDVASPPELTERAGDAGVTSLSIGTLQIEVGIQTRLALFAWGLHPRSSWRLGAIRIPGLTISGAKIETSAPLQRGVSLRIASLGEWSTTFDNESGWLLVASDPDAVSEQALVVANGVALGIRDDGQLDSLWLQPFFE